MSSYLGFDIGGTNIRVARSDGGAPAYVTSAPLPADYPALLDALAGLGRAALPAGTSAAGIGVGLPGVAFDQEVRWVPNISYLAGQAFAADLARRLEAPVFLANDAHLALLGEARFGAARAARAALLLSIGTGIGGAVLVAGRIYRGAHGAAGSFGWVNLGLEAPLGPEQGQLELLASGTALARQADALGLSAPALLEAARRGEAAAAAAAGCVAHRLGLALAGLVSTFDPELVLVSGGVSAGFDVLAPKLRAAVERYASPTGRQVPVRVAALGAEAGAFGAVAAGREREKGFLA